jgi:hypothetical protein
MRQAPSLITALAGLCFCLSSSNARDPGQPNLPRLPDTDRIRLAEAFRLADTLGNRVWPGWDKAPFAVLLVTPEHEFLVRHPRPTPDFTLIGEDLVLKLKAWSRKRTHSTHFLATWPAVGGIPTIVIGQAENTTSRTSTPWVITLLHEHFHQLQYSKPHYQADLARLGLGRGDQTGMWMLNYPFPYAVPEVKNQYSLMASALAAALQASDHADFPQKLAGYLEAKKKFRSLLKPDDYKYLSFQFWQEGIARYTECRLADLAAADYTPTTEFQNLKDYKSFRQTARSIRNGIEKQLISMRLERAKREVVYAFGAAEGLVLDRANPAWSERYFDGSLSLEQLFQR